MFSSAERAGLISSRYLGTPLVIDNIFSPCPTYPLELVVVDFILLLYILFCYLVFVCVCIISTVVRFQHNLL